MVRLAAIAIASAFALAVVLFWLRSGALQLGWPTVTLTVHRVKGDFGIETYSRIFQFGTHWFFLLLILAVGLLQTLPFAVLTRALSTR